jgi:hypothetical protein
MDLRLQIPISISAHGAGFVCGRDRVEKTLTHGLEPHETRGWHLVMSDDPEREI